MKVITLFGTRPEIIRLSQVIKHLDQFCEQILVHTGQNYDPNLSDIFLRDLELRQPDVHMSIRGDNFAEQVSAIMQQAGALFREYQPDRVLILGDTNSGLAAVIAARMGIPVFHMEAGNRCYDNRVPEEINRRVIDHCSDILMPYTHRSKENLIREGIERQRIYVIGNPIFEVLENYAGLIVASGALEQYGIEKGEYFLVSLHRAENVDNPSRLTGLLTGLGQLADKYQLPIIVSLHPRTANKMDLFGLSSTSELVRMMTPMGFFDFVTLEKNARCVISDSGTVQEECSIFRIPNVTLRDVTERAETIEVGSNILSGGAPEDLLRAVDVVLRSSAEWIPPIEYTEKHVASTVAKIVLGYHRLLS
ncbi:non-hydrolyzing UDP-N-acetylglucosamine 2-epimerase [Aggregatilinea lenta]|uniref:non-hydrolyzing UDP-N-acetylglucosamine 2-epimerase n=1 Tax=Aggregatilinea lenta TaxID=913108 RepID=UPI000E5B442D|nr:UDP-N-acetylglucosamine 2-epimerase (non-hydrolyzing) [Aggregatilinea lenta]